MNKPLVSIIIPTYNRKDSLIRTLDSLKQQNYPSDRYEIIVVDDGSTDGTQHLDWNSFPVQTQYFWQANSGATQARNLGALQSSAEILVFMDDDIVATPGMLENLLHGVSTYDQIIVLGTMIPAIEDNITNPFATMYCSGAVFPGDTDCVGTVVCKKPDSRPYGEIVHFTYCKTGVLSIWRNDFYSLEMFQDPTGGWPNWDDVYFGYRAHLKGFRFWRSYRAVAYHYDYSLRSLDSCCRRLDRISRSSAVLFNRHPELLGYMSYDDKEPISFSDDSPSLIVRKALRRVISSQICVWIMRQLACMLEKYFPKSFLLVLLYRWILSASMYNGYHCGLRQLNETCV